MDKSFRFDVEPVVTDLGVKVKCFLMKGLDNISPSPDFEAFRLAELARLKGDLSEDNIQKNDILAGFRTLHEKVGKTGKRWTSSPENLGKMLLATSTLPDINKIVNIYNLVSLQTNLALGAHDLEKITGNVTLRLTNGTEKVWPIGAKEAEKISAGEYAYCDDANEVICRLEVRQVEKTKVLPQTKDIFFIVQGNPNISDGYIDETTGSLIQLLQKYAGGVHEEL